MAKSHPDGDKLPYLKTQSQYFDNCAHIFRQPMPEPVKALHKTVVDTVSLSPSDRILDVGTGAGVLIQFFLESGVSPENIVGVDLSQEMLNSAKSRYPDVFFYQGDIAALHFPLPKEFPLLECFDVVFFNGCFGNMWDQQEALKAAIGLLGEKGRIVISHPLGSRFVDSLNRNEPHIVPHRLPDQKELETFCLELNLSLSHSDIRDDFYLVILTKRS